MRITSKLTTPFFSPCAFTIHKIASIELQKWKTNSTNVELLHVDMYICSVSFTKITEYQHDHSVVASTWLFCGWWHLLFSSIFVFPCLWCWGGKHVEKQKFSHSPCPQEMELKNLSPCAFPKPQ